MISYDLLNQWGEYWASFMLYQTLDSIVILLFVGMLWVLLRKKMPAQFGYCLFLLVLIKLVIPGQFSIVGYFYPLLPEKPPEVNYFNPIPEIDMAVPASSELDTRNLSESGLETIPSAQKSWITGKLNIQTIVMMIWGCIVMGLLAGFMGRQRKTNQLIKATKLIEIDELPVYIIKLKEQAGINNEVPLLTGSWVTSPVVWGLFRPMLLIPNDVKKRFSENQLEWICMHEFAHIRRYDNLIQLFQKLFQILFFFHPGVWLLNWLIDQQREYACDDIALKEVNVPRIDCGEGFLGVVLNANGMPTLAMASSGMINSQTQIKKRLVRILDNQRPLRTRLPFFSILLIIALTVVILPYGGKAAIPAMRAWTEIPIEEHQRPPVRYWPGMCYDSMRDVAVLHGGRNDETGRIESLNDTWEFDGEEWKLVSTTGPNRSGIQMVYDEARGVSIFFGGYNLKYKDGHSWWEGNSDTWQWDGKNWELVCESTGEPGQEHGLAYDPIRQKVIRHGGGTLENPMQYSNTYEWDAQNWTQIASGGPPGYSGLYFDSTRKAVMALAARFLDPGWKSELWELNGGEWIRIENYQLDQEPAWGSCYGFDPMNKALVLFGGGGSISLGYSKNLVEHRTLEWDGESFQEIPTQQCPSPRSGAELVYDSKRKRFILFGGRESTQEDRGKFVNDTWIYSQSVKYLSIQF